VIVGAVLACSASLLDNVGWRCRLEAVAVTEHELREAPERCEAVLGRQDDCSGHADDDVRRGLNGS